MRDAHRKLEFWLDPALLHIHWDPTWNQSKHLLPTKIEVNATFVQVPHGQRRKRIGPLGDGSDKPPGDSDAQRHRAAIGNGQGDLSMFRTVLARAGSDPVMPGTAAIEKAELQRMCAELRIPSDFDIAQISWRPDYDRFFYDQLSRLARSICLFRGEYIFDLAKAVVVETPQLGHATYVFTKPRSLEGFLRLYTKLTKDDIRRNRDNVGERLGFLVRVIHGVNPRAWLKEMRQRFGGEA